MKMKDQRWYEIVGETANVYDHPDKSKACGVSMVPVEGLKYYRNNFKLSKVWAQEEIERNETLERF